MSSHNAEQHYVMRQLTGGRKTNQNSNESSLKMQKSSLEFQEISIFDIQLSKGFQEMIHFSRKLTITICTLSEQSAIGLKGNLKCINGNSLSPLGAESKEIPAALQTLLTGVTVTIKVSYQLCLISCSTRIALPAMQFSSCTTE